MFCITSFLLHRLGFVCRDQRPLNDHFPSYVELNRFSALLSLGKRQFCFSELFREREMIEQCVLPSSLIWLHQAPIPEEEPLPGEEPEPDDEPVPDHNPVIKQVLS
jgi:hypothetical protein